MEELKNELINYISGNIKELKGNKYIDEDIKLENLASIQLFQIKGLFKEEKFIPEDLLKKIKEYESRDVESIVLESLTTEGCITEETETLLNEFDSSVQDGTIIHISTLTEYINNVLDSEGNNFLFRGMDDAKYKMMPSAFREGYTESEFQKDMIEFEKMIEHFDKTILTKTELEKHAYAQHYMFNTNLMDFTYAPLTALLFALEDYKSMNDAIIYKIDVEKYNDKIRHSSEKGCIKITDDTITQLSRDTMPSFIYSNDLNKRIHTQKGVFLYFPFNSANTTEQKEELHNKFIRLCLENEIINVYVIKNEDRNKILKSLFDMGINFENIYPELDAAAKGTKFLSYFRKNGGE